MTVQNLIIDPQISPNLNRRLVTSQIMQKEAPRIVIINPEYSREISNLSTEDMIDMQFLQNHEMLLTKENINNAKKFKSLVQTYSVMSSDNSNPKYAEAFDGRTVGTILRLFDALSENDEDLLKELKFWAISEIDEIIKHCEDSNLKKKAQSPQDLKRFNNLLKSISEPAYQEMFNANLELLYDLHQHFIEKKQTESFDFIDSSKVIVTTTNNVGQDTYMRALTVFAMLSNQAYVYLDSATPEDLLDKALSGNFRVFTAILNKDSDIALKRPFANLAGNVFISLQEPDFELFLEKLVQADSDQLKTKSLTQKSLADYFKGQSYSNLIGEYLVYDHKADKTYICTTNADPFKRFDQKLFNMTRLTKNHNKNKVERASKNEAINLPNIEKGNNELKSLLKEINDKADELLTKVDSIDTLNKNGKKDDNDQILKQIESLTRSVDKIQKGSDSFKNISRYRPHDIFGNPEDESDEQIDSALDEEFKKQDPNTKDNDPLQQHFMNQNEDDVESEMPNTAE